LNIVAIIQARIGSTRLPHKLLLSLNGYPIIEWVVRRVKKSKFLDDIVVAIPSTDENRILAKYIKRLNVEVYHGDEDDVLKRFYEAAICMNATHIVRVCADNPLISGEEIDHLIQFYQKNHCDYAYNHIPRDNRYPDGFGAEIVSFDLLKGLHRKVKESKYREHCLSYICDHPDEYVIKTFDPPNPEIAYPELKFDIDTFEDYCYLSMCKFGIDIKPFEIIKIFRNVRNHDYK